VIGSPFFPHTVIHGGSGDLVIAAPEASSPRKFVSAAKLGGEDLDRAWITEAELRERSPLSLETSPAPNPEWASGVDARPPSLTTHVLADFGCVP
jgi:putative alpha-1,2-mannosidase